MPQNSGNTASATAFEFLGDFFISILAFQFPGDIFRSISGHFNAAFLTVRRFLSHPARLQFISHFHQLTTSIILTLQAFLQLKYQWIHEPSQSPFSTHPVAMRVALASSAAHYLSYAVALRFPLHRLAFLANHLLVSSGYAAVAALSSVLLPDSAAGFVYAVFGLMAAAEFLIWLHRKLIEEEDEAELWIRRWRIRRCLSNVCGDLGIFYGARIRRLQV